MKSTTIVPGDKPLIAIRYTYGYQKVLVFISTDSSVSMEPGVPYLSHYPDYYYKVSIQPVLCICIIDRYFSACNTIDNHNTMQKSYTFHGKYWVTQSGYLRLATSVALGVGII